MPSTRMHDDEVETSPSLVRTLVAAQFPAWANLAVEPVEAGGTSNAIYRLGDELAVRMPRQPGSAGQIEKEHRWLPVLAPRLPLPIPIPISLGEPGEGYPWRWSVFRWLEGVPATAVDISASVESAVALAAFVRAFWQIDPIGGPGPGAHNSRRGVPLATRDAATRSAIAALEGMVDVPAVTKAWEAALDVPEWQGSPVWIHGDLLPGNLLVNEGRLSAVIDFGSLAVGDPACEAMPGWAVFSGVAREAFRSALEMDDASWARGRGWALSFALIALPYYVETNPAFASVARRTIEEVLADVQ